MCTLLISFRQHGDFPLLIAANRDEFHARPTRALHWWEDEPDILGGRDTQEGGTWFGVTRQGRFATLTNFRAFPQNPAFPSRGHLVRDYLRGNTEPATFLETLLETGQRYNGFNLLFGKLDELWYYSNRGGVPGMLAPGLYGLSNALLNAPWPKVREGLIQFDELFTNPAGIQTEVVLNALDNRRQYPDDELPETGIGLDRERVLSALFIESPGYGTRASWFLRAASNGMVEVSERTYLPPGEVSEQFKRQFPQ